MSVPMSGRRQVGRHLEARNGLVSHITAHGRQTTLWQHYLDPVGGRSGLRRRHRTRHQRPVTLRTAGRQAAVPLQARKDCSEMRQVAEIAEALHLGADELAVVLARGITRQVQLHPETTAQVPLQAIVSECADDMRPIFRAIADDSAFDPIAAAGLGKRRAVDGIALTSLMEAYPRRFRWCGTRCWSIRRRTTASRVRRCAYLPRNSQSHNVSHRCDRLGIPCGGQVARR